MKQIILLFACLFALQGLAKADDDRAITVDQLPQKVDCKYSTVPTGIVPQASKDYVSKHYPEAKILKIERDSKTYEVKLNNQLELEFNKAFQLIDIDN